VISIQERQDRDDIQNGWRASPTSGATEQPNHNNLQKLDAPFLLHLISALLLKLTI
jgi:hypothetical protein